MSKVIKIGVLRETKTPPDKRVALAPEQGVELLKRFQNVELYIQPSDIRAYTDEEYEAAGLTLKEDLSDCDVLIGVKEVAIDSLIPGKTYMFFSHTGKKQEHNRELLRAILDKKIELIDYEYLTDVHNIRLVAFGRWAGIVGAYNGLVAWGLRTGDYKLKRAVDCHDMEEFFNELRKVKLPPIKILITGGGRVAHGAMETLEPLNIRKVSHLQFLNDKFNEPVFCQLDPWHYTKRKDGDVFDLKHFFKHPYEYDSKFLPYTKVTDMFVAAHFWDPRSPVFMTQQDMQASDFNMKVIADISCDVGGPIPSTIRASTIVEPFYGYEPFKGEETAPFHKNAVTVMAVDNLPGEAPRNSSIDFGKDLIEKVFPSLLFTDEEGIVRGATIAEDGELTDKYAYLSDFVAGKE